MEFGRAEPGAGGGRRRERRSLEHVAQQIVFREGSGGIALEDDGARIRDVPLLGEGVNFVEPRVAILIRQPYDLERAVALDGARGVVVDAFARP